MSDDSDLDNNEIESSDDDEQNEGFVDDWINQEEDDPPPLIEKVKINRRDRLPKDPYIHQNSLVYEGLCEVEDLRFLELTIKGQIDLMKTITTHKYRAGDHIVTEGETSNEMYIILASHETAEIEEVEVVKMVDGANKYITSLRRGQYFGQKYFLSHVGGIPRNATVKVPDNFVGAFVLIAKIEPEQFHKWDHFRKFLLMRDVPMIQKLPRNEQLEMYSKLTRREYGKGDYIITQGDVGHEFFILLEGSVDVVDIKLGVLASLHEGHCFGEMALMSDEPRAASIVAITPCACLVLGKEDFREALSSDMFNEVVRDMMMKRANTRDKRNAQNETRSRGSAQSSRRSSLSSLHTPVDTNGSSNATPLDELDDLDVDGDGGGALNTPLSRLKSTQSSSGSAMLRMMSPGATFRMGGTPAAASSAGYNFLPTLETNHMEYTSKLVNRKENGIRYINKYKLEKELGKGAFGAVYLVLDITSVPGYSPSKMRHSPNSSSVSGTETPTTDAHSSSKSDSPNTILSPDISISHQFSGGTSEKGNYYAMKSLNRGGHWGSKVDCQSEIEIMKFLSHKNIVSFIGVIDDPSAKKIFIIQEFMGKGPLMNDEMTETGDHMPVPFPDHVSRKYFRDILKGMHYMHSVGIIHRDIKPQNVLKSDDDVCKLCDFGSAVFMHGNPTQLAHVNQMAVAGTPAFMPPELFRENIDAYPEVWKSPAVDIFALGVTLYCFTVGKPPWGGKSEMEMANRIMKFEVVYPSNCKIDPHLKHLLNRMMDKDSATRIEMDGIIIHDWVTNEDSEPLYTLEEEENGEVPFAFNMLGNMEQETVISSISGNSMEKDLENDVNSNTVANINVAATPPPPAAPHTDARSPRVGNGCERAQIVNPSTPPSALGSAGSKLNLSDTDERTAGAVDETEPELDTLGVIEHDMEESPSVSIKKGGLKKAGSSRTNRVTFYSKNEPSPTQKEDVIFLNHSDSGRTSCTPETVPDNHILHNHDPPSVRSMGEKQKSLSRTNQIVVVPTELVLSNTGEVVQKSIMISKETPRRSYHRSASMVIPDHNGNCATTLVPSFDRSKKNRRASCGTAVTSAPLEGFWSNDEFLKNSVRHSGQKKRNSSTKIGRDCLSESSGDEDERHQINLHIWKDSVASGNCSSESSEDIDDRNNMEPNAEVVRKASVPVLHARHNARTNVRKNSSLLTVDEVSSPARSINPQDGGYDSDISEDDEEDYNMLAANINNAIEQSLRAAKLKGKKHHSSDDEDSSSDESDILEGSDECGVEIGGDNLDDIFGALIVCEGGNKLLANFADDVETQEIDLDHDVEKSREVLFKNPKAISIRSRLGLGLRSDWAESIGGRPYMEDRTYGNCNLVISRSKNTLSRKNSGNHSNDCIGFFAIFDGHNGDYVAEILKISLATEFQRLLCQNLLSARACTRQNSLEADSSGNALVSMPLSPGSASNVPLLSVINSSNVTAAMVDACAILERQIVEIDVERQKKLLASNREFGVSECVDGVATGMNDTQSFAGAVAIMCAIYPTSAGMAALDNPCEVNPNAILRQLCIAHIGDCRGVASDAGKAVCLTLDHKPDDPTEKKRVEAAGGWVHKSRVNGVLGVARSFGDIMYKTYVTPVLLPFQEPSQSCSKPDPPKVVDEGMQVSPALEVVSYESGSEDLVSPLASPKSPSWMSVSDESERINDHHIVVSNGEHSSSSSLISTNSTGAAGAIAGQGTPGKKKRSVKKMFNFVKKAMSFGPKKNSFDSNVGSDAFSGNDALSDVPIVHEVGRPTEALVPELVLPSQAASDADVLPSSQNPTSNSSSFSVPSSARKGKKSLSRYNSSSGMPIRPSIREQMEPDGLWCPSQPVIAKPDVSVYDILPTYEFVVLACDGLWDVMSNQDVVNYVRRQLAEHGVIKRIAEGLVEKAAERGSADNTSVLVICVNQQ